MSVSVPERPDGSGRLLSILRPYDILQFRRADRSTAERFHQLAASELTPHGIGQRPTADFLEAADEERLLIAEHPSGLVVGGVLVSSDPATGCELATFVNMPGTRGYGLTRVLVLLWVVRFLATTQDDAEFGIGRKCSSLLWE